jgi:hypothetical protein
VNSGAYWVEADIQVDSITGAEGWIAGLSDRRMRIACCGD